MAGPYGFGRALWGRRPVASVADWAPLRLAGATSVVAAAQAVRARSDSRRYDLAFLWNLRRAHYELAIDLPPALRVAAAFTELARAI